MYMIREFEVDYAWEHSAKGRGWGKEDLEWVIALVWANLIIKYEFCRWCCNLKILNNLYFYCL